MIYLLISSPFVAKATQNNFCNNGCFSQLLTIFAMYIAGMLPVQVINFKDNLVELTRLHIVRPLLFLSLTILSVASISQRNAFFTFLIVNVLCLAGRRLQLSWNDNLYSFNSTLIFNLKY